MYNGAMPIRLIAIDIDGTLLDSHWKIPAANLRAVSEAVARGMEVALVTGRRFEFARSIFSQLPADITMIVSNGALIKSTGGSTHLRRLLPREVAREVLLATTEFRDGAAVVFDRPRENQVIWEVLDSSDPGRRDYFERNREFLAQVQPLEDCLSEDPIQVMFSGRVAPVDACQQILEAMPGRAQFALAVTRYPQRDFALVDVMQAGVSKGTALAEWAAMRGIARAEVMAIGDNLNDREMLEFAGVPVVMANAVEELKQNGWRVTVSNDEGGVAVAIESYAFPGD